MLSGPARFISSFSAAAILTVSAGGCSSAKADSQPEVETPRVLSCDGNAQVSCAKVEEHVVGKSLATSARIVFDENKVAHIFSPVTGRVTQIVAQLGQHVKAGALLAVITSPDMGSAMSDVDKAKPAVIQAEKMLKREKELYAAHADTQVNLEAAQAGYDQAVAELQRASEKVRLLMAQAHSSRVTQTFALTSPIEGEVIARNINPGAEVQGQYSGGAQQELYTIGRQDALWVLSDVYEQDLGRIKLGAPMELRTVAYPDKPMTGKVDWISGTLDPLMRTATVRFTVDNSQHLLKSQMYGTVAIETDGRKTLAIPRSAVLHFGDKTVVMGPPRDGKAEHIPVIVDEEESGDWVPVLHGLEPNQTIVTSGALLVSELPN